MFSSQIIFSSGKSCAGCIVLTSHDPELCNWWANNKTICNVPSAVSSMMEWRKIDSSIHIFILPQQFVKLRNWDWNIYEAHLIFGRSKRKNKETFNRSINHYITSVLSSLLNLIKNKGRVFPLFCVETINLFYLLSYDLCEEKISKSRYLDDRMIFSRNQM